MKPQGRYHPMARTIETKAVLLANAQLDIARMMGTLAHLAGTNRVL